MLLEISMTAMFSESADRNVDPKKDAHVASSSSDILNLADETSETSKIHKRGKFKESSDKLSQTGDSKLKGGTSSSKSTASALNAVSDSTSSSTSASKAAVKEVASAPAPAPTPTPTPAPAPAPAPSNVKDDKPAPSYKELTSATDIFVHQSVIEGRGWRALNPGDRVQFTLR